MTRRIQTLFQLCHILAAGPLLVHHVEGDSSCSIGTVYHEIPRCEANTGHRVHMLYYITLNQKLSPNLW